MVSRLYQKAGWTTNEHLVRIYGEGEINSATTVRKFRSVRQQGSFSVVSVLSVAGFVDFLGIVVNNGVLCGIILN